MNLFQFFTAKEDTFYLTGRMTIRQALEKFDYHKFTVVPLIGEDGRYLTTVSEGDILRFIKNEADFDIHMAETTTLLEIDKYRPYAACPHNEPINEVFQLALNQNFVPIVDDRGLYIGIVKRKDIILQLMKQAGLNSN